jgi:hypothetical protein
MEQTQVRTHRPPVLVVAAAVLGCVAAATAGVMALGLVGLGGLTEGGAQAVLWLAALSLAAVAQGWGVVRLLRRRGWLLLALASLPGLLPAVALVAVWIEYREGLPAIVGLAAVPLLALCCTLTPAVRRWAGGRAAAASVERSAMTSSGA